VPYPLEKGDKLRAFNQIRHLSKKHKVILFATSDTDVHPDAIRELSKYCEHIEIFHLSKFTVIFNLFRSIFSGLPFQVGYFYSNAAKDRVNELVNRYNPEHIYCQLIRTSEFVKDIKGIPMTLDYMDVFSKGMERRYDKEPICLKPLVRIERDRLLKYENAIFDKFTYRTIISAQDRQYIPHPDRDQIHIIPNGVDLSFFTPQNREKDFDLLFNGNMNYPPNVESVEFFVKKVMPLILKERPGTRMLISGATPSAKVKALASENVVVSGWVEDIRDSFARSKVLVAPMLISIGLQNKLLEAMAMRIPCITTTLANNAIHANSGEEVIIADTAEQFAQAALKLLEDNTHSERIAENGYRFVHKNYDWDNATARLTALLGNP
jgi:polysaccharide biosynthesis protein PslH